MLRNIIFSISIFLVAFTANAQFGGRFVPSPTPTDTPTPTPLSSQSQLPTTDSCVGMPFGAPDLVTGQQYDHIGTVDECDDANPCTIDSCIVGTHNGVSYYQGDDIVGYPTELDQMCISTYPACELFFYPKCSHSFFCPSPGTYCPRSDLMSGGHYLGFVPAGYCGLTSPSPSLSPGASSSVTPSASPSGTPFEPCIPTFCDADQPVCGQQSYGKDSCGNDCQIDGGVCVSSPTPSPSECLGGPIGCPSPSGSPFVGSPTPSFSPVSSILPTISSTPVSGNNPPTLFNIAVDQPNYCQVGLNISVNVRWSYADVEGNGQQSYQVQIDTDSNFGSPDFDSGETFSATHASGFVGSGQLKYAKRYYVRVRARDSAGQLSNWY